MTRKAHFPNLDGLRFLAFLAVFFFHSFFTDDPAIRAHPVVAALWWLKRPGQLGVNFFFVLSGFLITHLLLEEKAANGRIHIPHFYARRALRIWPLYFAMLFVGFYGFRVLKARLGLPGTETAHLGHYLLFLGNLDIINNGVAPDASVLGVLWSLAVEEQFYVLWPILLTLLPERHYPKLFLTLIAASLTYRWIHLGEELPLAFGTLSVISDMVVGAALALYRRRGSPVFEVLGRMRRGQIGLTYLLGGAAVCWLWGIEREAVSPLVIVSRLLTSVFFAFIIWEQNDSVHSLLKVGRSRVLTELGKISYGLYCLHFVGILAAIHLNRRVLHLNHLWWQMVFIETALALVLAIFMSAVSYKFFERPFLRLKEGFAPARKLAW